MRQKFFHHEGFPLCVTAFFVHVNGAGGHACRGEHDGWQLSRLPKFPDRRFELGDVFAVTTSAVQEQD